MKTEKFQVTGMTCAACQANVTKCVAKLPGVEQVDVSLLANAMTVTYDDGALTEEAIVAAVEDIGYGAEPSRPAAPGNAGEQGFRGEWKKRQAAAEQEQKAMKRRLVASIILLIPLMYVAMGAMMGLPVPGFLTGEENALISAMTQLLIATPILLLNRKFYTVGLRALWKRIFSMPHLSALARHFAPSAARRSSVVSPAAGCSPASHSSVPSSQVMLSRNICAAASHAAARWVSSSSSAAPSRSSTHPSRRYAVGRLASITSNSCTIAHLPAPSARHFIRKRPCRFHQNPRHARGF